MVRLTDSTTKISVAAWNINGLSDKPDDDYFREYISQYDCIILTETWLNKDFDCSCFTDFIEFSKVRSKTSGAIRNSGGITVLVKPHVKKGFKIVNTENEHWMWLKIEQKYFGIDKDLYICACYLPPDGSKVYIRGSNSVDHFSMLEEDIIKYKCKGNVLLTGDFNSRTGTLHDYIEADDMNYIHDDLINQCDEFNSRRQNVDKKVNTFGKRLIINICKSLQLSILNGRTIGDLKGRPTYMHPHGFSTIDYAIACQETRHMVVSFMVKPLTYLISDHHMIVTYIRVNNRENAKNSIHNTESNYYTYKWTNERKAVYCKALSLLLRENGDEILNADIQSHSDLDKFQININDMIIGTADKVLAKRRFTGKKKASHNSRKWFTNDLYQMKRTLIKYGRRLEQHNNQDYINKFYSLKKQYKKTVKYHKKAYKQDLMNKIAYLEDKNPKEFWNLIKQLKDNRTIKNNKINIQTWENYFRTLSGSKSKVQNKIDAKIAHNITEDLIMRPVKIEALDKEITKY